MRPALAPTAAADVLAGAAFAGAAAPLPLAAATGAALCLYTGGMVLNDLCDREVDRERDPHRPLVADPALVPRARALAAALFATGLVLGALAGLFLHALAVAGLAAAYDLGLKRTFPADALTMGAARAANLSLGLAAGGYGAATPALLYAAGYLLVIGCISAMSRAEDLEPPPTRRLALCLAGLAFVPAYGLLAMAAGGGAAAALLLLPWALHLFAVAAAVRGGSRAAAKVAVFRSLLLLFAVHAAVLWASGRIAGLVPVAACAAATFFVLALLARGRSA
jgi:4-hydroxybenzoate polyprenyltransferase